jgi:hypothetical protein
MGVWEFWQNPMWRQLYAGKWRRAIFLMLPPAMADVLLELRFRSSLGVAATSTANFGIKGTLATC